MEVQFSVLRIKTFDTVIFDQLRYLYHFEEAQKKSRIMTNVQIRFLKGTVEDSKVKASLLWGK